MKGKVDNEVMHKTSEKMIVDAGSSRMRSYLVLSGGSVANLEE